jgi:hypothetical protein
MPVMHATSGNRLAGLLGTGLTLSIVLSLAVVDARGG